LFNPVPDEVYHFSNRETSEEFTATKWELRMKRLKRNCKAWAKAVDPSRMKLIGVTLTYRPGVEWAPRDLKPFIEYVRRLWGEAFLGHIFVAEMQARGAPHYHVILAAEKGARSLPKPDQAGWWPHGSTRIQSLRKPTKYLMEYVKKAKQKQGYPKGMRICQGIWKKATGLPWRIWRTALLPYWLRERLGEDLFIELGVFPRRGYGFVEELGRLALYKGWWWGRTFLRNVWFLDFIEYPGKGLRWRPGYGWEV